jgi:chemotaxis family two-component system response regulator Rcp1
MAKNAMPERVIDLLLVEDSAADVRLMREALRDSKVVSRLTVATDGVEALALLRLLDRHVVIPRPDLILLDLNLPKKSGRAVLAEIKKDSNLKSIPVIVITSSSAEEDVLQCYNLHANCYITKPLEFGNYVKVIKAIEHFWTGIVTLPPNAARG